MFTTFFSLSLNFTISSSWSEAQSAPSLVFADCIELLHLWLQISLISVLTIWWCPCVDSSSCVVGRGCLLWPVRSLSKTLLAFALLHFVLQGQICLLLQVSLDFLFLHSSPLWWKQHHFLVLVLEGLVGLHRTVQLQLLYHCFWAYTWITVMLNCLPWKQIILSFLRLYPSTSFWTLLLTMRATPFLLRDFCPQ